MIALKKAVKYAKGIIKRFEILLLITAIIYFAVSAEKRIMASLSAISVIEARNLANNAIDNAVNRAMLNMNAISSDFYELDEENLTIYADTMLINELCSAVSENLNDETDALSKIKIEIPIGAALGIDVLANTGPKAVYSLRQMGQSHVDYETSFVSVGINQTNFKVWLDVITEIQMVNPLEKEIVKTNRKVMIIDSVIKGNVPQTYFEYNK